MKPKAWFEKRTAYLQAMFDENKTVSGLGQDYVGRQEVDGKECRDAIRQTLCWIWGCFSQVREVNGATMWVRRGRETLGWGKLWTAKTTASVDTKSRLRKKMDGV